MIDQPSFTPSTLARELPPVAQSRLPSIAELVGMCPIPEYLSAYISEHELAQAITALVRQYRKPVRVFQARGHRLVRVLGGVVFEVQPDGRLSVRTVHPATGAGQSNAPVRLPRPLATLEISLDGRVSLKEVRTFANGEPSKPILALARQCAWQVRRQHWMRANQTGQDETYGAESAARQGDVALRAA